MMSNGNQTLPLFPRTGGFPRSQSSRCTSTTKQRQQHAKGYITQKKSGSFISYTASRVNDLPDEILLDRAIPTSAHEDHRRRTIIVKREQEHGGSFGFTLQTYGIRHRDDSDVELITYVDSVEPYGSAARAGMRAGDVILSINGQDVESVDHNRLIQLIQGCRQSMRIVVLFEDCVRRVALHVKLMQLKKTFQQKVIEYNHFVESERNMMESLRNRGVDTSQLLKGSSELLSLTASSNDVSFPFKKHSKSFNRLSVSHSKSESRLLSDSSSNLASSSSTKGYHPNRPLRDTASCSTLPRLCGRRSSGRSLPSSAVVTPVGSLDGLEKGTFRSSSPFGTEETASDIESCLDELVEEICRLVEEIEEIAPDAVDVKLSTIDLVDELALPVEAIEPIVSYAFVDQQSPWLDLERIPSKYSDSGYSSIFDGCDVHFGNSPTRVWEQTTRKTRALRTRFPRTSLKNLPSPLVALFDCICSMHLCDQSEGHSNLMHECQSDLERAARFVFGILIAICGVVVSTYYLDNYLFPCFCAMTIFFMGF